MKIFQINKQDGKASSVIVIVGDNGRAGHDDNIEAWDKESFA